MWLSTKRKREEENSLPPRKATEEATSLDATSAIKSDWQSFVPWTRLGQPGANQRRKRIRPLTFKVSDVCQVVPTTSNRKTTFQGRAIFCLHDNDDPGWIQGYFIPKGSTKPWGMLAVREEVDDCMLCCLGPGYRRLSLTVYHGGNQAHSVQKGGDPNQSSDNTVGKRTQGSKTNSYKISGVEWTGGDMIALYHPRSVDMQSEVLLTGEKALPMLHKYFQGLIKRLETVCSIEEDSSVLEWLPNVAIVMGPMSVTIPI